VEGRFPFLDCRVVDYCNRLPANLKLRGLNGKYLLKQCAKKWLPEVIWRRPKHPYRAPIHRSFFNQASPEYVRDLCSPERLRESGLFKPAAVGQLVKKIEQGRPISETDDMALAGIISSQLVFHQFVKDFRKPRPLDERDQVKICGRSPLPQPA
jgi:asparagine synthase (glutamine-hydrolysing)